MTFENAKRQMEGFCHLCPRCDGRACAGQIPGMGGTETAATFRNNITALENIRVNMRTIFGGNDTPDTSLELFGKDLHRLFGMAVNGGKGDHDTLGLRLVG